ncbi:TIGR00725 family protein [Celeribacter sp. SCSIO 80788]|uniref:TIGR00725 family protein n=1 Tax=Celeribacter sp. SCSIO 80788 TaxID=3117013 RepID=UPI003DA51112
MTRMITIGLIGRSSRPGETLPPVLLDAAEAVGKAVAQAGAALVTGGTGGVMEASSRGAKAAGGLTVGFLPYGDAEKANAYCDLVFPTGMGTIRNILTARCCHSLIMLGGGVGTLNELTVAYDAGVPVVALEGCGGWSDRLRDTLYDGCYLDERRVLPVSFAATPEEAVEIALSRAHEPRTGSKLQALTGWAGG